MRFQNVGNWRCCLSHCRLMVVPLLAHVAHVTLRLLRFNWSSLLSQGSLFGDLIQQIRVLLEQKLLIKYDPCWPQFSAVCDNMNHEWRPTNIGSPMVEWNVKFLSFIAGVSTGQNKLTWTMLAASWTKPIAEAYYSELRTQNQVIIIIGWTLIFLDLPLKPLKWDVKGVHLRGPVAVLSCRPSSFRQHQHRGWVRFAWKPPRSKAYCWNVAVDCEWRPLSPCIHVNIWVWVVWVWVVVLLVQLRLRYSIILIN